MRICLYTETALPQVGGQEIVVDTLARTYQMLGHDVVLLAPAASCAAPRSRRRATLPCRAASAFRVGALFRLVVSLFLAAPLEPPALRHPALPWALSAGIPRCAHAPAVGRAGRPHEPRRRLAARQRPAAQAGRRRENHRRTQGGRCLGFHQPLHARGVSASVPPGQAHRGHTQRRRFGYAHVTGAATGELGPGHRARAIRAFFGPAALSQRGGPAAWTH